MRLVAAAALLSFASLAGAADWHAFIGFGRTKVEASVSPELDTGASMRAGFRRRLSERFWIEGGLGMHQTTQSVFELSGSTWTERSSSWEALSASMAIVGEAPLSSSISIIGSAGVTLLRSRLEARITDTPIGGTTSSGTSSTRHSSDLVPSLGIGVAYEFLPNLRARALHEATAGASDSGVDRVRTIWVEIVHSF